MALFVFWREGAAAGRPAGQLHALLDGAAHIAPDRVTRGEAGGPAWRWHFVAYATRTHFYTPEAQVWQAPGQGACVIHGLIWRMRGTVPELLDAAAVAALLDRPGAMLPGDVMGEYAVVRLLPDGSLVAFSDRPGLHQLFHAADGAPVVANRASLAATVLDDAAPDPAGQRWLAAIGYRVGTATAYRAVRQLAQERVLRFAAEGMAIDAMADPIVRLDRPRGFHPALDPLLDEGIAQAQAAIRLGIPADGPVDLPITGGKDSRVVLALCLAAGLRDRLRLFTRGYAGHPDVVAGAGIAAALGLPHRREAPHGSDDAAVWSGRRFFDTVAAQAWQSDHMVGGWDLILGTRIAADTLISGHMGEVLKAYSKKPLPEGPLDPVAMVRLQAPFDPMGLLHPEARAAIEGELAVQMDEARAQGAREGDLPDLFYYRNRLPNWLGAIRAIKSFERQPVVPLGAPALLRLAFQLTPEERKHELLHWLIISRCAPVLLAQPFAFQSWDPALGPDAPYVAPVLPAAGAPPAFGNWQYSLNSNASIRAALAAEVAAHGDLALWRSINREALVDRLHHRRLDYFDGISMLGLMIAIVQERGLGRPVKIGAAESDGVPSVTLAPHDPPRLIGHLDGVEGAAKAVGFGGWAYAPDWPAAQVALEARVRGQSLGVGVAGNDRPDLVPHGVGDGRHGFSFAIPRSDLIDAARGAGEVEVVISPFDGAGELARVKVVP
ncbi:hypothetical protein [Rhizorhabdus dicambivorans]|uniref:Asparagine synthetase domain-containing protein n=1 Tax=Rhizorhabdus dicambivorans TaxID=1850238 RepID=A0A2A4FR67_9SPHN|nr:hypothetical protein [Rhizorhabdus dicambivorans]ATE64027.1 hypothetical protein CMV14_06165 [Rhizorhabdus dicambivorans]PCE40220.1 hypothetical protein COO09_21335 [Rhizorhabdus dicambivorans]